jgi:glycosyltransferase involved in cell wall biosynthesis
MRLLVVSESPLEKIDSSYYGVDPWIKIPRQLSEYCEKVTVLSPLVYRESLSKPLPNSWLVDLGKIHLEPLDYYYSFVTYYKLWPARISAWKKQMTRLVKEADVVIVRVPSPILPLAAKAARKLNKPMVMIVLGNTATQSDRVIESKGLVHLVYSMLMKFILFNEKKSAKSASRIYAYSSELAERFKNGEEKDIRLMQDPHMSLEEFKSRGDTCESDTIKLLRVCWLIPSKGVEYLLDSISLLLSRGHNVHLEIVGKERYSGYLAHLEEYAEKLGIREKVTFAGWYPIDRIWEAYYGSDIQILSSLGEGSPRVIVEGFARGLPLVCTSVGGCVDYLTHEKNTLFVPPKDPEAMADAVERLITDKVLRKQLIQGGYDVARSATFEIAGMQFIQEIEELVNT